MRVISVPWHHPGAVALRAEMTAEMSARYADRAVDPAVFGVEHDSVVWTGLVMGRDGHPTGHAALRTLGGAVELKRLFVTASHRGRGVAAALLDASHHMARSLGHQRVVLQTGTANPRRCGATSGPAITASRSSRPTSRCGTRSAWNSRCHLYDTPQLAGSPLCLTLCLTL